MGSALAAPADTGLGGPAGVLVLAVAPRPALALLVPAILALLADHNRIIGSVRGTRDGGSGMLETCGRS
ncbi:hypothetical protein GCM10023259_101590 [Thermocatellispora tengchongensis]